MIETYAAISLIAFGFMINHVFELGYKKASIILSLTLLIGPVIILAIFLLSFFIEDPDEIIDPYNDHIY